MYINFKIAEKRGISEIEILTLSIIKQLKTEPDRVNNLAMVLTDSFEEKMSEKGYIHKIKGKKSDSELSKIRLTKKGTKLYRDLFSYGEPDEDSEKIAEWLKDVYAKRVTSVKSNFAELKRRIHWFSIETEIYQNHLATLLTLFINDTYVEDINDKRPFNVKFNEFKEENPRAVLSSKAENMFWTPPNHFAKDYTLESSPLWDYYRSNEKFVQQEWEKLARKRK